MNKRAKRACSKGECSYFPVSVWGNERYSEGGSSSWPKSSSFRCKELETAELGKALCAVRFRIFFFFSCFLFCDFYWSRNFGVVYLWTEPLPTLQTWWWKLQMRYCYYWFYMCCSFGGWKTQYVQTQWFQSNKIYFTRGSALWTRLIKGSLFRLCPLSLRAEAGIISLVHSHGTWAGRTRRADGGSRWEQLGISLCGLSVWSLQLYKVTVGSKVMSRAGGSAHWANATLALDLASKALQYYCHVFFQWRTLQWSIWFKGRGT